MTTRKAYSSPKAWRTVSPRLTDCTLMYIVNNYYDGGKDEFGIAWNDPQVNIDWGISAPALSNRDQNNPLIADIPADAQPS